MYASFRAGTVAMAQKEAGLDIAKKVWESLLGCPTKLTFSLIVRSFKSVRDNGDNDSGGISTATGTQAGVLKAEAAGKAVVPCCNLEFQYPQLEGSSPLVYLVHKYVERRAHGARQYEQIPR